MAWCKLTFDERVEFHRVAGHVGVRLCWELEKPEGPKGWHRCIETPLAEEACRPRFFYPVWRERARENVRSRERNVLALRPSGPSRPPGHGGGVVLWVVLVGLVELNVQIEVARNYRGTSLKRKGFDKKQAFLRQDFYNCEGKSFCLLESFLNRKIAHRSLTPPPKMPLSNFREEKTADISLENLGSRVVHR